MWESSRKTEEKRKNEGKKSDTKRRREREKPGRRPLKAEMRTFTVVQSRREKKVVKFWGKCLERRQSDVFCLLSILKAGYQ